MQGTPDGAQAGNFPVKPWRGRGVPWYRLTQIKPNKGEMAMKTKIKAFLFFTLFTVTLCRATGDADDGQWKYVGTNNKNERCFYQPSSITRPAKDVVVLKMMVIRGDATKSWTDTEINCHFKIIRDLRSRTERINKPPLMYNLPSQWRDMIVEFPDGNLFKAFCR
jgi:hypothetical protein